MADNNQEVEKLEPNPGAKGRGNRLVLTEEEEQQIVRMAEVGCSVQEMCAILGKPADRSTLQKWYGDLIDEGRSIGNERLRRIQFRKAVDDENVQMLIWLGKQRLGQAEVTAEVEQPLPWSDDI